MRLGCGIGGRSEETMLVMHCRSSRVRRVCAAEEERGRTVARGVMAY